MAQYIVNAPDRVAVSVSTPYGTQTFMHDTYMYLDPLAEMYPHIFVKSPVDTSKETVTVVPTAIVEQKAEKATPKPVQQKKKGLPTRSKKG